MENGTFGEHLRREREMRGVSLDEVSQATRIGTRFLLALENERWQDLPGGVFNRGFIRSISRYLGLDEEAFVAEYAQVTHDRPQVAEWRTATTEKSGAGHDSSGRLWLSIAVLLVLLGIAGGGWWGWMQYGGALRAWRKPLPPPPEVKPPAAPAVTAAATPSAGENAAAGSISAVPDALEPAVLELRVEVSRPTEVTVAGDGKKLYEGRMSRGESRVFKAQDRFEVTAKNSFALVLELNGQSMAPVGQPDSSGSVTLTRKDLKKVSGDAH
jgi:cytoskeletal protein RodZ